MAAMRLPREPSCPTLVTRHALNAAIMAAILGLLSGCGLPFEKHEVQSRPPIPKISDYNANDQYPPPNPPPPITTMWVGDSYVYLGAWDAWFVGSVNAGEGGDTIGMVLARVQAMTSVPPTVYVWCGINDLNAGVPRSESMVAFAQLINRLHALGAARIICLSTLPLAQVFITYYGVFNTPDVIDTLDAQLQIVATTNGAEWKDIRSAVAEPDGWCSPQYSMATGIHLNEQGYGRVLALLMSNPG